MKLQKNYHKVINKNVEHKMYYILTKLHEE